MNLCYTLMQTFIFSKSYIMFYICRNISLVNTNFYSKEVVAGLQNLSSMIYIIRTNGHLLYIPVNVYSGQGMYHALYL